VGKRYPILLIWALVSALSLCGQASAHDAKYPSTVSIFRGARDFHGKVRSAKPACKKARNVTVLKQRSGPDRVIGTALTARYGYYRLKARQVSRGIYYARVSKAIRGGYGHTHICQKARSRYLSVPPS
jgi:hypothetical protein